MRPAAPPVAGSPYPGLMPRASEVRVTETRQAHSIPGRESLRQVKLAGGPAEKQPRGSQEVRAARSGRGTPATLPTYMEAVPSDPTEKQPSLAGARGTPATLPSWMGAVPGALPEGWGCLPHRPTSPGPRSWPPQSLVPGPMRTFAARNSLQGRAISTPTPKGLRRSGQSQAGKQLCNNSEGVKGSERRG